MQKNPSASGAIENDLLAALRPEEASLLTPYLQERHAAPRQRLYDPGDEVTHAYFPCGATVVSFLVVLERGQTVDVGLVGREGAVGGIVSQGRLPAYARAEVQLPGRVLCIPTKALEAAKARSPVIQGLFARYADCLLAELFQGVACNAAHTIEQRTAKWLLSAMDRTGEHEFRLTQDQVAEMLGIGRSYFTRVVKALKSEGIIETKRGMICVKDPSALQQKSCACNEAFRQHVKTSLDGLYPVPAEHKEC